MFIDDHQAKQLHYDIMGVGLAVRGHAGECELYRFIDAALTALDWERMLVIRRGLALLPQHQQEDILSDDVAADGILVNCIHPGSTRTPRQQQLLEERARREGVAPDEMMQRTTANIPIGRMVEPEDIANLILFLVSGKSSAITGQTVAVDGGAGRGVYF